MSSIHEVNENYTMSGVVITVSVPTEAYEKELEKRNKKLKSNVNVNSSKKQCLKESVQDADMDERPLLPRKNNNRYNTSIKDVNEKKCNCLFMEKVVQNLLKQLKIENPFWTKCSDNRYVQATFTLKIDNVYEEVLEILKDHHIGNKYNSSVRVVPCILHYDLKSENEKRNNWTLNDSKDIKQISANSGWSQFLLSIRARLTVGQVAENIRHQAALTFDFICLLLTASAICAIGLVENNNVYLISSMLISPMMGPVMASTFGKVINDRALQRMGVVNEVLGVVISTIIGFICGTIICLATDRYGEIGWPTYEMMNRGETRTIGVGCLIALFSGAAVAVAVLSDNISPAVGVAISTSLMPPAVNAGLLWSMASVYYLKGNETTRYSSLTQTDYYFDDPGMELTSLGAVSLCLTFVNIICIYFAGILTFKFKEVAPIASKDSIRRQFWSHDIKIARDYNKNQNGDDTQYIEEDLLSEFPDYRKDTFKNKLLNMGDLHYSTDLAQSTDKIKIMRSQYTWSPCTLSGAKKPTIQEVLKLYNKIVEESDPSGTLNLKTDLFNTSRVLCPFKNNIGGIRLSEENLTEGPKSPKGKKDRKLSKKGKKKFVVTPCDIDVEKGECGYS